MNNIRQPRPHFPADIDHNIGKIFSPGMMPQGQFADTAQPVDSQNFLVICVHGAPRFHE
jgi:hypothetical protein